MDVWLADQVPKNAFKVRLKPEDEEDVLDSQFHCVRIDDRVTITFPGTTVEPNFVMCNGATKTVRDYVDGKETKVTFSVPKSQEAEITIVKLSELQNWVTEGSVRHLLVEALRFGE